MSLRSGFLWLGRDNAVVALLVLQVAVGVVLLCEACQSVAAWQAQRRATDGMAYDRITVFQGLIATSANDVSTTRILARLRRVPGVELAAASNQVPHGYNAWSSTLWAGQGQRSRSSVSVYLASEDFLETLGVPVRSGRDFLAHEYTDYSGNQSVLYPASSPAIVNTQLARRLSPDGNALGRTFRLRRDAELRVVGIADIPPPANGRDAENLVAMLPVRMTHAGQARLLVRTRAEDRLHVASLARRAIARAHPSLVIAPADTMSALHDAASRNEHRWAAVAVVACAIWWLLVLTALWLAGQRWVQAHALELSLRRAFGARPAHLARRLRCEYLLIACIGSVLGMMLWQSPLPRWWLPWASGQAPAWVVPASLILSLIVAQLAASWPSHRAKAMAPHNVSRSPSVRL